MNRNLKKTLSPSDEVFSCALGMGVNLAAQVRRGRGGTSLPDEGKGVCREAGSGGSRRQSHSPMNRLGGEWMER
ncbi:hypothetical protein [Thermicanus aegyptius]|uniref:hypothetical protein n=1 Tax=Thermicanus aegyptius TaxID=94009 RepID=UPI00034723CE|nr:hypothetical protein [Thermicanus aegyptius]